MTFGNLSDEISKKRFIEEAQKLSPISIPILESTPKKSSAVLVPLIASKEFEGGLGILYCKRSTFLRRHAREICFPGGKIDPDETPIQAAIRECVEEIGIDKNQVEVWTSFPELPDIFGIKGDVNNDPFNNGNMLLLFRRGPGGAGGGRKKLRRKALHETTTHLTKFNDFESENLT